MPLNNSPNATDDLRVYLDRALESEKGIKLKVGDRGAAVHLRHRLYSFRVQDRKDNAEIFPPGHELHGRSHWDSLGIRIDSDNNVLIIKDLHTIEVSEL